MSIQDSSATRHIGEVELPAPGTWTVDPGHAEVAFIGRHFGLTKTRGRFTGVEGTVEIAEDVTESEIHVTIDTTSVSSGSDARDEHLRSDDLFAVEAFPTATFHSTSIDAAGSSGTVTGELTIKDVTRPVTLDVSYLGSAIDPWDNQRAVFSASTRINRDDWGVGWNMVLDTGGLLVSKEIAIEIEVELIRQA